ncbi:hypothetical protein DPMN_081947 [Dreissena polymorpha]|uniref:Uncharacterized protein n=1 Tax=Dreissena polymorpha TaxID=45954 RepID=A0A9D4BGT1_DREPO|nr:hypothetical protein DPMN_081892 [Dreissena polymorpha]KAH3694507.1 hypothetical protein DPMN_081947 [Dreissena polymorpha]
MFSSKWNKRAEKNVFLNLWRHLSIVPDTVWRNNIDTPEEGKTVSMDDPDDRWSEQTDLTKLILASNWLTELSEDISNLQALTVLDVGKHFYNIFCFLEGIL